MKMASSISGELWHRLVTRATTKVAGPEPSKGSRSRLDIDSPNFRRLAYSPTCLERLYEKVSNTDEPPRHEANHRSVHERFSARTKSLVIFAHPPVLADPSDRPLHHPPTR